MKTVLRHLSSFVAPTIMGFGLPYLIVRAEHADGTSALSASIGLLILGAALWLIGLALLIATVRMFILIGRGTIMPWDPTRKLITGSLYGHVRNPMILGVLILQVGETLMFASTGVAVLAVVFFVVNTVYFIYSEEPGLEKRFGAEYVEYKQNVPRWLPRLKSWRPGMQKDS